jgi:hypothetical protein
VIIRRYLVAPIAILSTACAARPFTPSVSVAYWSEEVPGSVQAPTTRPSEAIGRWQLPTSDPWSRYTKLTLLGSLDADASHLELPDVMRLDVVQRAERAAAALASAGLPSDTLWMVDLRGPASVAFGAALTRLAREPVSPVLTFNNWPAENELIPAEETLAALLLLTPKMPAGGVAGRPVFLLDSWRLAYRFDAPDEEVYDNRYVLNPTDLPDAETLRAQGITRVVYIVDSLDDTDTEEDDLHEVFLAYQAAGVSLHLVDLTWAEGRVSSAPAPLPVALGDQVFVVRERVTILSSPIFYNRARGGFGGVHVGATPMRGTYRGGFGGG